ncbi:MAG: ATP-binding protein [Hydrogenophaga sp.]|uniref:ATP-binding protein n=1 Tax=Hydrogenophaga sp. TaxID=1904254 RepID=UPI002611EB46|nr:ATP-binding protein [Hydrogenophaga sp.]MCW5672734.1 ATP-binding protein [Hydrogenophaga sp.]
MSVLGRLRTAAGLGLRARDGAVTWHRPPALRLPPLCPARRGLSSDKATEPPPPPTSPQAALARASAAPGGRLVDTLAYYGKEYLGLVVSVATIVGVGAGIIKLWRDSDAYATRKALHRLQTKFERLPGSTPIAGIEEKDWLPREEEAKAYVRSILFEAPGRAVIVGPSGSGKTSTVLMVARGDHRDGIVFVNMKPSKNEGKDAMKAFARAFGVDVDKVDSAIPEAIREYHAKTGRFATVIVEDVQGLVYTARSLLQFLAECIEAKALNLVFLSSEGDLPSQLRSMSGWSNAVAVYELNPISEAAMREHLQQVWHLEPALVSHVIEQIGTGARDIFERVLGNRKPGEEIEQYVVEGKVAQLVHEAVKLVNGTVKSLAKEEILKPKFNGIQPAAVLLLDHLLTTPETSTRDAFDARSTKGWPTMVLFDSAADVLISRNILHRGVNDKLTWHRGAMRTAYNELQHSKDIKDARARKKS